MQTLRFLGRHASIALPMSVALGILFPALAELLSPILVPFLLIPLTLSLVRIKTAQLIHSTKQWKTILLLSLWLLIICPTFVWLIFSIINIPKPIAMAAIITAAAPPLTACTAIALFLRVDAAIAVVITVVTMLLIPLTLPPVVQYLVGLTIELELWQLSLRLISFILVAFGIAFLIKKHKSEQQIKDNASILDGISVIFISLFTIGVMRGVTALLIKEPEFVLLTLLVSSVLMLSLYILSCIVFWRLGKNTAMAVGLVSGNCNLGLMYLVLADQAPLELLIFFAVGQIPMYCLPTLLLPVVRYLQKV
jgi:BASS family bile acid:Na+ symporter